MASLVGWAAHRDVLDALYPLLGKGQYLEVDEMTRNLSLGFLPKETACLAVTVRGPSGSDYLRIYAERPTMQECIEVIRKALS